MYTEWQRPLEPIPKCKQPRGHEDRLHHVSNRLFLHLHLPAFADLIAGQQLLFKACAGLFDKWWWLMKGSVSNLSVVTSNLRPPTWYVEAPVGCLDASRKLFVLTLPGLLKPFVPGHPHGLFDPGRQASAWRMPRAGRPSRMRPQRRQPTV